MTFTTIPTKTSRMSIAFRVVRIALALAFLGAAAFKLSGHPAAVAEFNLVGLGQWFRYATAAVEVFGSVLLLWPRMIVFGALLLLAVCVGAFLTQLTILHGDVIHTVVLAVIFVMIAWTHREQATVALSAPRTVQL